MGTLNLGKAAHRAGLPWIVMRDLVDHGRGPAHRTSSDSTRIFCPFLVDLWTDQLDTHPLGDSIRQTQECYRSPGRRLVPQQRRPVVDPNESSPRDGLQPIGQILPKVLVALLNGRLRPTA